MCFFLFSEDADLDSYSSQMLFVWIFFTNIAHYNFKMANMDNNIIMPPYLRDGDKVVIVSPSGAIESGLIDGAAGVLRSWGLQVRIAHHAKGKFGRFSGTDSERLEDLQSAFDDEDVRAVICSRGGYGAVRILDKLNFEKFKKSPKWLVGFSDITALHSAVQINGFASVHGIMTKAIAQFENQPAVVEALRKTLFGLEPMCYAAEPHKLNRQGEATGVLVGGNLSVLYGLRGTPFDVEPEGKILFIEDLGERAYHIDRMVQNLKLGGVFSKISGLIVGHLSDIDVDMTFGTSVEEIISAAVSEYDYPVCFGFPVGHEDMNLPLICGATVQLEVGNCGAKLKNSMKKMNIKDVC